MNAVRNSHHLIDTLGTVLPIMSDTDLESAIGLEKMLIGQGHWGYERVTLE